MLREHFKQSDISIFSVNVFKALIRQLLAGLFQLAVVVIIARAYGPEASGSYAVALLLPGMLAVVLNMGVAPANVYYLGAALFPPKSVLKTSLRLAALFSVVGVLLAGALLAAKGDALFPGVPDAMLFLAIVLFPLNIVHAFMASIFQGLQRFKHLNVILIMPAFATLVAICCIVTSGRAELYWLIVANIFGVVLSIGISVYFMRRHLRGGEAGGPYSVKTVLGYGYKAHLSNILAFINYKADIFLLNFFSGPAATGIYVVAANLGERLWMLSQAVSTVGLPHLSAMSGNEDKRREMTTVLTRLTLLLTACAAALLGIFAYPLIYILFGPQFEGAVWPLLILLPGLVAGAGARVLANDMAARGKPQLNMYTATATVGVNVGANIILIPMYGFLGAAIATTTAYSLNLCLRLVMFFIKAGVPPREVLRVKRQDFQFLGQLIKYAK